MRSRADGRRRLATRLEEVVLRVGESPAVVEGDVQVTFSELWRQSGRAARALRTLGIDPGEPVASWSPWTVEVIVVHCAALRAANPVIQLDPDAELDHVRGVLAETGARVLFARASHEGRQYPAMIKAIRDELLPLEHVVVHGRPPRFERVLPGGWLEFLGSGDASSRAWLNGDAGGATEASTSWLDPVESPVHEWLTPLLAGMPVSLEARPREAGRRWTAGPPPMAGRA